MVDPSVHRYHLNLSESDESSGGSDFRSARKSSDSSVSEGTGATSTQGKVRKSRSRTRRPSANSAVQMNSSRKEQVTKNSEPIDEHSKEESSSASSSSASRSSSSSESEAMQSSPKAPMNRKSCSDTQSATSSSTDQSMQSSSKAIPKMMSNPEPYLYSETSSSEDESKQSPPKGTSKGKSLPDASTGTSSSEDGAMQSSPKSTPNEDSNSDTNTVTSCSEDESMQSSPKPASKGKLNSDTNTGSENKSMQASPKPSSKGETNSDTNSGTSGSEETSTSDSSTGTSSSEDEAMQTSPKPTSNRKSNSETNTGTSSSEDDSIHASPQRTSMGKSIPDASTGTSNWEDEAMQSSPKPTSKGKSISHSKTETSSSEDEPMQSSPKLTAKGKSAPEKNIGSSSSKDESMRASPKITFKGELSKENKLIGLEEVSCTPISDDENEHVLSKLSDIQIDIDGEKSLFKTNPESVEDQQRKVLGDKLTVKFKVTLPEIGDGLIGGPLQFLRVPQFIPVESGAFDAETFKDSMTPDDLKDEQARGDFLNRLKTTVRWRENKDQTKESNARIVRWSDGSETFHVGSEVFDVMHHKVIDDKNHLYVRLENCYQAQGSITDKMTLRPKLDSTFGQSHVQGMRNRAMNKPLTGVVKVLSDLVANPLTDRERRAKEEIANLRREDREKRREIQMSMKKPRVKPMRHCTADDSDPEQPADEQEDLESETTQSVCSSSIGRSSIQGIRTNRNVAVNPGRLESNDEEDEEDGSDSDVSDLINDDDLDGDDEEMSDEPSTSTSKSQKAPPSIHSSKSDSDEGSKSRIVQRKTKRLVYSESDSD